MIRQKLPAFAFSLMLAIGGIILGVKGFLELRACFAASGWPSVNGTITNSSFESKRELRVRKPSSETHTLSIRYVYEVGGSKYTGDQVTFGGRNLNSRSDAETYIARFPVGASARVWYDPANPSASVLDPSTTFWSWVNVAIGIVLIPLGIWLMRWVILAKPPVEEPVSPTGHVVEANRR